MYKIINYLNPIAQLGKRQYSYRFPFLLTALSLLALELCAHTVLQNISIFGMYAIFIPLVLVMYLSFRDGILGGVIATLLSISYYFYIIYDRHYTGHQLTSGIGSTIVLAILYLFLASTIGWLKQTIDILIDNEADARKRLEAILQQLPVGVMIADSKGIITHVNKQVDKILGIKIPVGFILGKNDLIEGFHKGKPISPTQGPLMQVIMSGKEINRKEYTTERKDGEKVYLQVSATTIRNKRGKIIAAASIINNMTDQKEMEKRKDDFVNIASHELKTPITSMKLYIDLLIERLRQYNDPQSSKIIKNIKTQTDRLQDLVNDLLDVSRIQTGKLAFRREQFRLDFLIKETIEGLKEITKQTIKFSKPLPLEVYADKFRIYQVLTNFITNAIKYSSGQGDITIQIKKEKNIIIVSVKDFGIGIAKEQQKKIFEKLYQVTGMKEKTFPGFGMGLYISKEIIKRHKGKIWVESEIGKGSTFYFSLPLK